MDLQSILRNARLAYKRKENRGKPPLDSSDVVRTEDFVFRPYTDRTGDSGKLLLAQSRAVKDEVYLVKHELVDCACNEFVYTKLAQAMGYTMPDAVLFSLSPGKDFRLFDTEYVIGERFLNVIDPHPKFDTIRQKASNWVQYFSFWGLFCITGESDSMQLLLADDSKIYRIDTTSAFPVSDLMLNMAGVDMEFGGQNPNEAVKQSFAEMDLSNTLDVTACDRVLKTVSGLDQQAEHCFFEPFQRIQDVNDSLIDDILNTLCYFYPDYVGEFFRRYFKELKVQCRSYLKVKRVKGE